MKYNPPDLIPLFLHLRTIGLDLGVGELLAAIEVFKDADEETDEQCHRLLKKLWCKSIWEFIEFDDAWKTYAPVAIKEPSQLDFSSAPIKEVRPPVSPKVSSKPFGPNVSLPAPPMVPQPQLPRFEPFPIQSPFVPLRVDHSLEINAYWPVPRRSMVYAWKYLSRWVSDGPADILDLDATIEQVARQGFFLSPVFRRRDRNVTHVLFLVDQDGSMVPFHRMCRDLVETAQTESNFERVDVLYFHNFITSTGFLNPHLTQPVLLEKLLGQCSPETFIFIISDAGAGRGHRRMERFFATTKFLNTLKQHSQLIAWLNPVPQERWVDTTAAFIARQVAMFEMDRNGLHAAIDLVRG